MKPVENIFDLHSATQYLLEGGIVLTVRELLLHAQNLELEIIAKMPVNNYLAPKYTCYGVFNANQYISVQDIGTNNYKMKDFGARCNFGIDYFSIWDDQINRLLEHGRCFVFNAKKIYRSEGPTVRLIDIESHCRWMFDVCVQNTQKSWTYFKSYGSFNFVSVDSEFDRNNTRFISSYSNLPTSSNTMKNNCEVEVLLSDLRVQRQELDKLLTLYQKENQTKNQFSDNSYEGNNMIPKEEISYRHEPIITTNTNGIQNRRDVINREAFKEFVRENKIILKNIPELRVKIGNYPEWLKYSNSTLKKWYKKVFPENVLKSGRDKKSK